MSTAESIISNLYDAINEENHDDIFEYANRLLSHSSSDINAITCKCLAKINMGDIQGALSIAEASPRILNQLVHVRAYIHYRLGNFRDALKLLENMTDKNDAYHHLIAQTYFKMGRYERSAAIYEQLLEQDDDNIDNSECVVNALAAYTAALWHDKMFALFDRIQISKKIEIFENSGEDSDGFLSYELVFNYACALTSSGRYTQALAAVKIAQRLVSNSEGVDEMDDDVLSELDVMTAQEAYIEQSLGNREVARSIYSHLLSSPSLPSHAKAVLVNNEVAMVSNIYDHAGEAYKKLQLAVNLAGDKLGVQQRHNLKVTLAVLLAWLRKVDEVKEIITELTANANLSQFEGDMIIIFSYLRDKQYSQASDLINSIKSTHSTTPSLTNQQLALLELAEIQVLLYQGHVSSAITSLNASMTKGHCFKAFPSIRDSSAVMSLFVTLHTRNNDMSSAAKELDHAINIWKKKLEVSEAKNKGSSEHIHILSVLRQLEMKTADLKVKLNDVTGAIAILDGLCDRAKADNDSHSYNMFATRLVSLACTYEPTLIAKYVSVLPDIDISDIDIAALEAKGTSSLTVDAEIDSDKKSNGKRVFTAEKLQQVRDRKAAKRARQMKKLPKGMTPEQAAENVKNGFVPDPYRWKPKWERPVVGAKKGVRGKNLQNIYKGPQGSGTSDNTLEVSLGPKSAVPPIATAKKGKYGKKRK